MYGVLIGVLSIILSAVIHPVSASAPTGFVAGVACLRSWSSAIQGSMESRPLDRAGDRDRFSSFVGVRPIQQQSRRHPVVSCT